MTKLFGQVLQIPLSRHAGLPVKDGFMRLIILTISVLSLVFAPAAQAAKPRQAVGDTDAKKYASMVIDAGTGAVISSVNPDKRVHPASLTKVMTIVLLFEAMENGTVGLRDKITISERAAAQQPSKIGLKPGSTIRVEDAILAIVTKSANDIAVAIAEHIAGSEDRFAMRMTRRAREIGMKSTNFENAHGLHDPKQVTSARDMVTLARYVLTRYPNYYHYFGTKQFTYRGKTYTNHNRLMNTYPGMDGFKTGFINASGFNLIASARRDGRRLVGVVFGGRSWKSRNDHMAALLNTGFAKLGDARYAGTPIADPVAAKPAVLPIPEIKPLFKVANSWNAPPAADTNFVPAKPEIKAPSIAVPSPTSLASLETNRKAMAAPNTLQLPPGYKHEPISPEQAAAQARNAVNRGDYSEITGEGDDDPSNASRVVAGLLSATIYKEDQKADAYETAALAPETLPGQFPPSQTSSLWSVQIGAYNSRVMTDDAIRRAQGMLPASLAHATPVVVPLQTAQGTLYRGRLGNLTRQQASDACRYFRDCLPIAP